MSLVLDQPHLIDTLRYRVFAERRVPQTEVRVAVRVNALVHTRDRDRTALERRIREALSGLAKADWAFLDIQRESDAVGYERVTLWASARIPAGENYDLEARCRAASGEGLTLSGPSVDYSLPRERVDAVVEELRLEILGKIARQVEQFRETTGRPWRIGDVAFGVADYSSPAGRLRSAKGAFREAASEGGDEPSFLAMAADQPGVSGAEKVSLVALVALKAPA